MNLGNFTSSALGQGQQGVDAAQQGADGSLAQIKQSSAMQMKMQTEMGQIQMLVKMNEALSKIFKAIGDAIKGLA